VNFPPRQIATFFSEVLTLGVILGDGDICLVHPDRDVPLDPPFADPPPKRFSTYSSRIRRKSATIVSP